jgi:hypothetical protein
MRALRNVLGELMGMFAGDLLLSLAALLTVGIAVAVRFWSCYLHIWPELRW